MNEPKPFASLSSGLLARKGQAKPAMRPQGFASFGTPSPAGLDDLGWNDMGHDRAPAPQIGLSPMDGDVVSFNADVEREDFAPVEPVVFQQREEIARSFEPAADEAAEAEEPVAPLLMTKRKAMAVPPPVEEPVAVAVKPLAVESVAVPEAFAPASRAAPGSKNRAAFTLRLDQERHLKLRLASAVTHRSAQLLVVEALDAFLANNPALAGLNLPAAN